MKISLSFRVALLVALAAALPLKAQDQPSAANVALAGQLVDLMHLDKAMTVGLNGMKQMQSKMLDSGATNSSPDTKAVVQKTMDSSMAAAASIMTPEKMHAMYVSVYASTFTTEELQGAIDFYKSPVGQKWIEKQPRVSMAIMAQTTQMMMAAQPQMMEAMKKSMAVLESLRKSTNAFSTNLPMLPSAVPHAAPTN